MRTPSIVAQRVFFLKYWCGFKEEFQYENIPQDELHLIQNETNARISTSVIIFKCLLTLILIEIFLYGIWSFKILTFKPIEDNLPFKPFLQNSTHDQMWNNYFQTVYHENSNILYPFGFFENSTYFYLQLLPKQHLRQEIQIHSNPQAQFDYFTDFDPWWDTRVRDGILHKYLYPYKGKVARTWPHDAPKFQYSNGIKNFTKIEVWHTFQSWVGDPGFWMYFSKGTGIFYDVGKTIVFEDHWDATKYFLNEPSNTLFSRLCNAAHEQGFDSIQFTHRAEGKFKYEILDTRLGSKVWMDACPGKKLEIFFTTGLNGNKECKCVSGTSCLNCNGFPEC